MAMLPEASGWHEEKNKLERNRNIRFFGRAISAPSQGPDRLQRTTLSWLLAQTPSARSYAFIRRSSAQLGVLVLTLAVWNCCGKRLLKEATTALYRFRTVCEGTDR
mmetsp:Transcript_39109/g.93455  ORF Transcript_39109/g.93455 Transcript_39109/m.93455 type:complete len:106 (+) Transcript_39109:136-453(+)